MIDLQNVSCGYGKKEILSGINLQIQPGEFACILGKNGMGKTTLFKTILGFIPALHGTISISGKNLRHYSRKELARKIGYVPQAHGNPFPFSAVEVVLMGGHSRLGHHSKCGGKMAVECLEMLHISHLGQRNFSNLSSGEKQLVLIARVLAQNPSFIAMDEPTANLDIANACQVMSVIRHLRDQGYGIIVNTHSPEQAANYADSVIMLKDGHILSSGSPSEIMDNSSISRLYDMDFETLSMNTSTGHRWKTWAPIHSSHDHPDTGDHHI